MLPKLSIRLWLIYNKSVVSSYVDEAKLLLNDDCDDENLAGVAPDSRVDLAHVS